MTQSEALDKIKELSEAPPPVGAAGPVGLDFDLSSLEDLLPLLGILFPKLAPIIPVIIKLVPVLEQLLKVFGQDNVEAAFNALIEE